MQRNPYGEEEQAADEALNPLAAYGEAEQAGADEVEALHAHLEVVEPQVEARIVYHRVVRGQGQPCPSGDTDDTEVDEAGVDDQIASGQRQELTYGPRPISLSYQTWRSDG